MGRGLSHPQGDEPMTTQGDRHTDGGVFEPTMVTIRRQVGSLIFFFRVEGLRCSGCDEEIITRDMAAHLEQTEQNLLVHVAFDESENPFWTTLTMPAIIQAPSLAPFSTESEETRRLVTTTGTADYRG